MPYGESKQPGQVVWLNTTPITVANSPLLSGWLSAEAFGQVWPTFVFAGGTSVHTIEYSLDGLTVDADFAAITPVTATAFVIPAPFFRWKTVQSVADSTKSKVVLRARI
jgi:hypothetical protein